MSPAPLHGKCHFKFPFRFLEPFPYHQLLKTQGQWRRGATCIQQPQHQQTLNTQLWNDDQMNNHLLIWLPAFQNSVSENLMVANKIFIEENTWNITIGKLIIMIRGTRSNYSWDVLVHFQLLFAIIWTLRIYHDPCLPTLLFPRKTIYYHNVVFVVLSRDYNWCRNEVIQINS